MVVNVDSGMSGDGPAITAPDMLVGDGGLRRTH
jgi:hypothetical protein